jgi:hypothetical protein
VGCAPVTPAALTVGATVHACGWDHRVARVTVPLSEGGDDAVFLIPLPHPDTHFVGVRCSARRPDAAQCEGRCNGGCAMEDISPSLRPGT